MSPSPASRTPFVVTFLLLAIGITWLDLWSKVAVFDLLQVETVGTPPEVLHQKRYVVIPGCFELEANYNYGAFKGWFSGHTEWLAVLSGAALVVFVGILVHHLRQAAKPSWLLILALGCLFGGTAGNLYDRWKDQAVRDWIKWFYRTGDGQYPLGWINPWPNFNIADSAICTGVGLILLLEVVRGVKERRARQAAK